MTDFASIGVKMETEPVARGIKTLEQLAATGPKVERSMSGVEQAATKANKSLKGLGDGADKGLNAVGTAAPRAEQSLGRVAKNADEAKRSIAEMNRSASGLNAALRGDHLVRGFSGIETGATAAASAVSHLNYMLALTGAGISINSLIGWSDGYTKLTAQLRNATDSAQDYAYAMEQVKRISEGAQAGIGELGVLYARIASSTKELGISQAQVAKITETVALSLKANGASAAEASSAMLQLSQAFGSGVLRGEEFNAVYEAAPNLLRNLADAMGVPQGKLREMASDGKLTAEVLAKYLPESLEKVRKEAERMATIGGAFTVLNNKIMEFVGEANQASGAAKAISGGIVGLANNLDTVATAAGVVALVMAGRYTASMATAAAASVAAATAAVQHQIAMARTAAAIGGYSATTTAGLVAMTGAARAASLAMGALGGPVGLAVTAIGLGAAAFYSFGDSADVAKEKVASLLDPLDELTAKLSALPAEKRVAVTLDLKEEQQRAVEAADAAVDALIQSVGDLTNMRLPAGEWNELRDRVEGAAKSGQDLTPILTAAANSASLPEQHLNKWLQLAGNLRVVQKEAAEAANKLAAITGAAGAGGGRGSVNPKTTVEAAAERWVSQQFLAQRNNGITKQFAADIEGLAKAYANGALSATEYARAVTEANKKRYESTEAGKAEAKAAKDAAKDSKEGTSAILSYIKSLEARTAAQRLEIAQGDKLTESQRARIQLEALLADSKSKASKSQIASAQASLAESEANEAWLKNASDVEKALADMQKAREQSLRSVQDSVKKLVEEAEATAYAEMHNISLAEAVERLALARAENAYQQAVERQEAPATLDYLRQEIEARKQLVAATAQKGVKEANAKAAEQAAKDWERVSQTIGDTLADYIMGGGKDAATYLKRLFSTLVLQPVVQTVVGGIMGTGAAGASGGIAGALGTANNLSSLYSAFSGGLTSSLGSAIGSLGSAFGSSAITSFAAGMKGATLASGLAGPTTAGASGAMGLGASFGAAVPWLAGGLALASLFGGSFGSRGANHSGGVYSTMTSDRNAAAMALGLQGDALGDFTSRGNAGIDANLAKTVTALIGSYNSLAQSAGTAAKGLDLVAGFAANGKYTDEDAYAYFKLLDKATGEIIASYSQRDGGLGSDVNAAWAAYVGDMAGALVTEIKKADIPQWMRGVLDGLGEEITVDGFDAALKQIAAIDAMFGNLGQTMSMFAGITGEMQTQLLKASGSFEALAGNTAAYYQSYYSESERIQTLREQVNKTLADLGVAPLNALDAFADGAKERFKAELQNVIATGQGEIAAAMLSVNQAFAQAADYAAKAAQDAAKAAEDARQRAIDGAMRQLEYSVGRERDYWSGIASKASEAVSSLSSAVNLLQSNARDLYGSVDSAAQMQAVQGMLYVEDALAAVKRGASVLEFDKLQDAITAARGGISGGVYASEFERQRDTLVLAGQLSELGDLGDAQLSVKERSLKAAQEQINQLEKTLQYWQEQIDGTHTLIDKTMSVEQAVLALSGAMSGYANAVTAAQAATKYSYSDHVSSPINEHGSHTGVGDSGYQIIGNTLYFPGGGSHAVNGPNAAELLMETYGLKPGGPGGTLIRTRARGGYTPPGLTLVGEEGPELVNFKAPAMVYTAAQSANLMGGNTTRLESLVEGLTAEVQRLQAIVNEGNKHAQQTAEILDQVTEGGTAMVTESLT